MDVTFAALGGNLPTRWGLSAQGGQRQGWRLY
jgi:hypothetical protein